MFGTEVISSAFLNSQGWAYDGLVQTGGRPAVCWWPVSDEDGGGLSPDNPQTLSPWVVQPDADNGREGSNSAEVAAIEAESAGKEGKNSEPSTDDAGTSFLPSQDGKKSEASGLLSFLPEPEPPQADATEALTDEQWQAEMEAIRLMVLPKD